MADQLGPPNSPRGRPAPGPMHDLERCRTLGFQKLARIHPESLGELAKHRDRRAIDAGLKLADVATIHFRPERKLLLAPPLLGSEPPQIPSNGVPQIVHQE